MKDWRTLKINDTLKWIINEFGVRHFASECKVVDIDSERAIAQTDDGLNLWIDDDTCDDFERR